jgi:antitoxin ParD1/3/4
MSTISVELTDHFRTFVEAQVASGRFKDANDVLHEGLRLLEKREAIDREKLELLRTLVNEGLTQLDQGQGISVHNRKELRALIREQRDRAKSGRSEK